MNAATIRPRFGSLAEQEFFDRFGARRHAEVGNVIERCLDYSAEVPSRLCQCDGRCAAHDAAHRYAEQNQPERFARFLRLVERWRAAR